MTTWGNGRDTNPRYIVSALVLLATACSERHSSVLLTIEIDADSELRNASAEVEAIVERQDPKDSGWVPLSERRFELRDETSWPLTFQLDEVIDGTYQVTATARDNRGALIALAKTTESISDDQSQSSVRPCAEHERCISVADSPRCACSPGFVSTDTGCSLAEDPRR
jgi:hypothetical protein